MKRQWSMIVAIILFLIVAILSVLNVDPVPVNFGFTVVEWPLIIVIFASLLLGALIATLLSTFRVYKEQRKSKKEQKAARSDSRAASSRKRSADADNSQSDDDSHSKDDDSI